MQRLRPGRLAVRDYASRGERGLLRLRRLMQCVDKGARPAATRLLSLGGTRDDGMDAQAQCMRRRGKAPKSKRDTSAPLACTQVMLGKAAESASTQE